jgi:membrane-associated protease RseP (regulator of RpoE activity)
MEIWLVLVEFVSSPLFIISLVFWIIGYGLSKALAKKNPTAITFFFPFIALFRTKVLNRLFRLIASRARRLWRFIWNTGIVVSFILMMYALYFIVSNLVALIVNPLPQNALLPLIPGVTIDLPTFTMFILPLLIVVTVHEFSHAIAAEIDNVTIKSSGILGGGIFFVVLYGAFVELDEFHLDSRKVSSKTRMRVASAGIWSNVLLALLVFGLIYGNNFAGLMRIGYEREVFRINQVIPLNEGGFNEGNVFPGDIVTAINGTPIDVRNGKDLTAILNNQTDIECSVGDKLELSVIDANTREATTRNITLGFRAFVGFEYSKLNESAIQIGTVYPRLRGGNNEGNIIQGAIIMAIDGIPINYSDPNTTLALRLKAQVPNYRMNLTAVGGQNYTIDVTYFPRVAAAFYLEDVFTGLAYEEISSTAVKIIYVLANSTEGGINEGRIPNATVITHINGVAIDLSKKSFRDFVKTEIAPAPGDILIFKALGGQEFSILTRDIPVTAVYVGIMPESYWLAQNWLGRWWGPTFPNWLETELWYLFVVSFSVALFNLLPVSVFDGGRLIKELIHLVKGSKYMENVRRKMRYEFNPKDGDSQTLMTFDVHKVYSVNRYIPKVPITGDPARVFPRNEEQIVEQYNIAPVPFNEVDSSNIGLIDMVKFPTESVPQEKCILEVDLEGDVDELLQPKKKILSMVSWIVGLIILGNFIISLIKFGSGLFWL